MRILDKINLIDVIDMFFVDKKDRIMEWLIILILVFMFYNNMNCIDISFKF